VIPKKDTTQSYANMLKGLNYSGNTSKNAEDKRRNKDVQQKLALFSNRNDFKEIIQPRRPLIVRYENMFIGYCLCCHILGTKPLTIGPMQEMII
jgi:hypothetical protein